MKKIFAVLVLAAFATGSLAAQVSIGAGGYMGGDFGGGAEVSTSSSLASFDALQTMPYFGGGGYLFFDARYVELSLGLFAGGGTSEASTTMTVLSIPIIEASTDTNTGYTMLTIGALAKYPFSLGKNLSIFPLIGVEYDIMISSKNKDTGIEDENSGDLNALWFKLGGGLDFSLTGPLYLRFGALYGLRFVNQAEKDIVADMADIISSSGLSGVAKSRLGHGVTVKLALGYRF